MKKIFVLLFTSFLLLTPLAYSKDFFSNSEISSSAIEPKLMPVDQAFVFDYKQVKNQLSINFVIADGYYLYKDKLKFSANGATIAEISLPKGKMHHDEYFGDQEVYTTYLTIPINIKKADKNSQITVSFMGCAEGKLCFPPTKKTAILTAVNDHNADIKITEQTKTNNHATVSEQDYLSQMLQNNNALITLLIFFGLGIGLALTPCVFPMYPILSGIIVGQKEKLSTAKAFTLSMAYVQGMAITYSLLGLVVASAGLKYQAAFQHPVVLISLAILFFILSLSMFGLYELTLPSRWQNKMNALSHSQKSGKLVSVFMMGAISGLIASPCTTAPLSGALIYVAQTGNLLLGFFTLYVLSMGMGLPLLIIGTSGGKLLPKAGRWMEIIKTVFGFLLIAVSIIMIGRVWTGLISDLLWSLWGICLAGYLIHQNKMTAFSWQQTVRSVLLTLSLLACLSYGFQSILQYVTPNKAVNNINTATPTFKLVHSIEDLNQALALAKKANKAVLLDFYADWCVACKEFEDITFKDKEVKQRFSNMVLLKANVTDSSLDDVALLEHYQVLGLPTLLMFNAQGEQMKNLTVTGFMKPKAFSQQLDLLLTSNKPLQ